MGKLFTSSSAATDSFAGEVAKLREAAAAVQKIRLSAQRELELARQMRTEAQRYLQESEAKARSQAQQLILRTRIAAREATKEATRKEIDELIQRDLEESVQRELEESVHRAEGEIQKMLADVRAIRITAQEELAALKKYIDAARIYSLASTPMEDIPLEDTEEPEEQEEKQLVHKERKGKKQLALKK